MPTELSPPVIAAIATIVAALITAALAFVNLTLTKELKTSEFRQVWIDALREDLSLFFSAARAVARTAKVALEFGAEHSEKTIMPISSEKISDLRVQGAETFYRIKLRLNPKEDDHEELLRLLKVAIEQQNKMLEERTSNTETLAAIDRASDYARPVLKKEWDRVKLGEPQFRRVRTGVLVIFFLFVACAVIAMIAFSLRA
jgi:hypothetical protein